MLKNIKLFFKSITKNKKDSKVSHEIIYRDRIIEKKIYLKESISSSPSNQKQQLSNLPEKLKNNINNLGIVTELHHDGSKIKKCILKSLENAETEIKVVVPWLSDKDIIKTLNRKTLETSVNIIISSESSNDIKNFSTPNIKVIKRWGPSGTNRLHDKFCIIDNKYILCGSFNYSRNAISNEEFIVKLEGSKIIDEFNYLYNKLSNLK